MTATQSDAGNLVAAAAPQEHLSTDELILLQTRRRCNPDIQMQIDRFAKAALRHQLVMSSAKKTRAQSSRNRISRRVGNLLYLAY